MTIDAAALAELKQKHGAVHEISVASGETVVVKMPDRALWKRFRAQMHDPRRSVDAPETLLRSCVVSPDEVAFDALLNQRPGLAETFSSALMEIAGLAKEGVEKKAL